MYEAFIIYIYMSTLSHYNVVDSSFANRGLTYALEVEVKKNLEGIVALKWVIPHLSYGSG